MPKSTPKSPGDIIKSAEYNGDIDGLSDGSIDTPGNSLKTFREESFLPYFRESGAVWSVSSGLVGSMTAGVLYISGERVPVNAVGSKTFSASQDTYIDVSDAGAISYNSVSNNATPPSLAANSARLCVVVTNSSSITSIVQSGVDAAGNFIKNTQPVRKLLAPLVTKSLATTGTITPTATNTEIFSIEALTGNITINAPTGGSDGQGLLIRVYNGSTQRSIAWGSGYAQVGVTLPTVVNASKSVYIMVRKNTPRNAWEVLSVGREA